MTNIHAALFGLPSRRLRSTVAQFFIDNWWNWLSDKGKDNKLCTVLPAKKAAAATPVVAANDTLPGGRTCLSEFAKNVFPVPGPPWTRSKRGGRAGQWYGSARCWTRP